MITAFTVLVGTANLILVQSGKTSTGRFLGWTQEHTVVGIISQTIGLAIVGQNSEPYLFIFDNILNSTGSTMFSLTAFYIGSSAFRVPRHEFACDYSTCFRCYGYAWQGPNREYVSRSMPDIAQWIMDVLNAAGQRGS